MCPAKETPSYSTQPSEQQGLPLTPRESQVLTLAAKALSNRRIARSLGISEKTVKNHLGSVYAKLAVRCRMEAVVAAGRLGLIDTLWPLGASAEPADHHKPQAAPGDRPSRTRRSAVGPGV